MDDARNRDDDDDCSEAEEDPSPPPQQDWIQAQERLKAQLILRDDFNWQITTSTSSSSETINLQEKHKKKKLLYIGGVDLSFSKNDPSLACAALIVLDAQTLQVVCEHFDIARLHTPYLPGFLAFREAPIILGLLSRMKQASPSFYPQLLMVDGNGLLHPRGFGLACHLGVLADLPAIGIGKNLHHVDGLTESGVRQLLGPRENSDQDIILLTGHSGQVWGAAMRSAPGSSKPIYVSVGHRISLDSAVTIVKGCCKFRVPEPVRQADIRSKVFLQRTKND